MNGLRAWYSEAEKAEWRTPGVIKQDYRSASIVGGNRVVFNICGNKHRLVVKILYAFGVAYRHDEKAAQGFAHPRGFSAGGLICGWVKSISPSRRVPNPVSDAGLFGGRVPAQLRASGLIILLDQAITRIPSPALVLNQNAPVNQGSNIPQGGIGGAIGKLGIFRGGEFPLKPIQQSVDHLSLPFVYGSLAIDVFPYFCLSQNVRQRHIAGKTSDP